MKDAQPRTIYLKDYQEPDYWIDQTDLTFHLGEDHTDVTAVLQVRLNKSKQHEHLPNLVLDGTDMQLLSVSIDNQSIDSNQYTVTTENLSLPVSKEQFVVTINTRIKPQENTSLEGLYRSNDMFCTQCEAEGFRKITYYLDRPDVMAKFSTTIIADPKKYPVMLSNGNLVADEYLADGLRKVKWEDPFKKPCYLFALVAGDLACVDDEFITQSGRKVALKLFTEAANVDKCAHALLSLKRSMKWDEDVYGREYDLDIFMIVAVDHFNMGAMENKGLNIFNSSCVLAKPETATDGTYQRIEAIVAHEYFHNWSGNRVTCRDWFQLSLKEGFTVFRDAEFSADMNSRPVKRIEDANFLRTMQFPEDAGPTSHPVRPASYIEISNFYTLTVYEKGAEVVRMIHNIVGKAGFRKGSDLYFSRHDGQAVTTEDFVKAMEEANNVDLTQFRRWYTQSGTPVVQVSDNYDAANKRYTLTVKQKCPPTPGQVEKAPFHIPFAVGLIDSLGNDMPLDEQGNTTLVLDIKEAEQTFTFNSINEQPLPSLARDFSAPIKIEYPYTRDQLMFLMSHDNDGFNRWDAGQKLAVDIIKELVEHQRAGMTLTLDERLVTAYKSLLTSASLDKAMLAKMLALPSEDYIAEECDVIYPLSIHVARDFVRRTLAVKLHKQFKACYAANNIEKAYQPTADDIAERSLKNICLSYLTLADEQGIELSWQQYQQANNMTDRFSALSILENAVSVKARDHAEQALASFYQKWQHDVQMIEQWLSVQAGGEYTDLEKIHQLMQHEAFDMKNPNKVRALIGVFANRNKVHFHRDDGAGYAFLADQVLVLNRLNPQMASRLLTPITRWKRYDETRGALMKEQLQRIMKEKDLSKDVYEIVSKSLQ